MNEFDRERSEKFRPEQGFKPYDCQSCQASWGQVFVWVDYRPVDVELDDVLSSSFLCLIKNLALNVTI